MRTASCILLALFFFTGASLPGAEREGCSVCGMYLDLYAKTRFTISLDDGSTRSFCSLACAAMTIDATKTQIKDIRVAEFLTGALIDAKTAFFLEGSDVPGVMSNTSWIAFSSKQTARKFRKEHGGKIIGLDRAVRDRLEELE